MSCNTSRLRERCLRQHLSGSRQCRNVENREKALFKIYDIASRAIGSPKRKRGVGNPISGMRKHECWATNRRGR